MLKQDVAYVKQSISREAWGAARAQALREGLKIGQWIEKIIRKELKMEGQTT